MSDQQRRDSFFKCFGARFVALIAPVSVTMLLVVWSVITLSPIYISADESPLVLVVDEREQDSTPSKIGASFLNAFALVAVVVAITFLTVLLYKCHCVIVLYSWLAVSAISIFFVMAWIWLDLTLTVLQIPYTYIGMTLLLWNVGVVGTVSLFYYAHPAMTQWFLIFASMLLSWSLTALPEWTTWCILLCIATYDVVAVLCPGGPLKLLIEAADSRNEPIPGFVFDSSRSVTSVTPTPSGSPAPTATEGQRTARAPTTPTELLARTAPFKLGLGDFIFYSLLVGKSATFGLVPWVFCFIAILSGMVGTLTFLYFFNSKHRALPALPFSIYVSLVVFFICRYCVTRLSSFACSMSLVL